MFSCSSGHMMRGYIREIAERWALPLPGSKYKCSHGFQYFKSLITWPQEHGKCWSPPSIHLYHGGVRVTGVLQQAEARDVQHHYALHCLLRPPGSRYYQVSSVSGASSEQNCVNSKRRRSEILYRKLRRETKDDRFNSTWADSNFFGSLVSLTP